MEPHEYPLAHRRQAFRWLRKKAGAYARHGVGIENPEQLTALLVTIAEGQRLPLTHAEIERAAGKAWATGPTAALD
jgi:hypothetical protein